MWGFSYSGMWAVRLLLKSEFILLAIEENSRKHEVILSSDRAFTDREKVWLSFPGQRGHYKQLGFVILVSGAVL